MLKAKLRVPVISKNTISRKRVLEKLQQLPEYKLALVVAPAGYGKTTAVLELLQYCRLPAAWLSLDRQDDSPAAFWRYVFAAVESVAGGIGRDAEYAFASRELMDANIHINILIERLTEAPSDFLLVLDDLHLIGNRTILLGLSYLIDYLPPKMHLIFISRSEPELKLARHRITGQILRVDERDLRFDEADIAGFYRAKGYALGSDDLKEVGNYTEGWAAALVAVAMSMQTEGSGCDAIAALKRSSRDIGEYLRDEVLSSWAPEKLDFAIKTCILETLSEPLCDAVTGAGNARRMLGEISEKNGFLLPLDDERCEYRYHHLFSNFLKGLLAERAPGGAAALYLKAARYFQEKGDIPQAIEYLLAGGVYREALELIEHQADHLIHQNDYAMMMSWIEQLPEEMTRGSFHGAYIYTMHYAENGQYQLAHKWLAKVKGLADKDRHADPARRNYFRMGYMLAEANLLLREGDPEFFEKIIAAAEQNRGRFVMPKYFDLNTVDIYFCRCSFSKAIYMFGGDPGRYAEVVRRYREFVTLKPGYFPLIGGEFLYEAGRLEEALPRLLAALEEAQTAGCAGALVPAMVHMARMRRAKRDMPGAFEALRECKKRLQGIAKPHWNYLIDAFLCRLNIELGAAEEVEAWFAARTFNIYSDINRIREFEMIVYARALIFKGCPEDASVLLQRLLVFTESAGRPHSEVEVLNLLASLACRDNNMSAAMDYLERSLAIGIKQEYIRSYTDEFDFMPGLLRYYVTRRRKTSDTAENGALQDYAKRLLLHMQENPACPEDPGIKQLLTAQETKVLTLLAKANTNAEISARLGIGIRTVKTHTGNIYSKLGVKNRAQCMKLVRETNLI